MATMLPANVETFATSGERQFYRFLEKVALPDDQFVSWYLPDIEGREPDFILLHASSGLVVFEVKDWTLDQIREANPYDFMLTISNRNDRRQNPLRQARGYSHRLRERIERDGLLISKEPNFYGKLKIPINYAVVFPNINKLEYKERNLNDVIHTNKIFFWDDLHPSSDICTDPTGNCFLEALAKKSDLQFPVVLTGKERLHLKQLVFPEVKIQLPNREPAEGYTQRKERIRILDNHQEALARKFDGGHRILVGPSGSGKTLILVHKAAFLMRYNPSVRRVLFVCYNITLVNYIKRLLADRSVPLGEQGVDVLHFYELCAKILGQEVDYENEGTDYYEMIDEETLTAIKDLSPQYDAILVDEGQDFSDNMYRILTATLNPVANHLTVALDENQNIYRKKASWKEVGVQARGRTHRISSVYRNTVEIAGFADRFIRVRSGSTDDPNERQQVLFPDFYDFHGPAPDIIQLASYGEIAESVAEQARSIVESERCPLSEIAVIYAKKSTGGGTPALIPQMMESALGKRGVLCSWVSEGIYSKRSYDITTNRIAISTIHSAKGLDYAHAFIVGLDLLDESRWSKDQIESLTYVAITRARYRVIIPYTQATPLIGRLLDSL